jgi:Lar family restriction alleviation protein
MADQLARCPFCGKAAPIVRLMFSSEVDLIDKHYSVDQLTVVCDARQGGCGATSGYKGTEEEAIQAWNKRARESISRGLWAELIIQCLLAQRGGEATIDYATFMAADLTNRLSTEQNPDRSVTIRITKDKS